MEWFLLLAVGVLGTRLYSWPHFRAYREAKRKLRAECAARGHDYREIVNALDNPHWPTRHCKTCGYQDNLTRCPCGAIVDRTAKRKVDVEDGA